MSRQIMRNIARNRMRYSGVRNINKKGANGKSYFALNWRRWLCAKPRKPSLWRRLKYWWYRFKLKRRMKTIRAAEVRAVQKRKAAILRDQKFRQKHSPERERAVANGTENNT